MAPEVQIQLMQDRLHRDKSLISTLEHSMHETRGVIKKMVASHMGVDHTLIQLGSHGCATSPSKRCVYETVDTCSDHCLFCHDPHERK